MRLHIQLDRELVEELDKRAGKRKRSAYIAEAIRRVLDDERKWEEIEAGMGTIEPDGHVWDPDPAAWVHEQRAADTSRSG